jgi:hypothetical protein
MITCPACLAAIAAGAAICTACVVPGPAPGDSHYPATGQPVISALSQPFARIGDVPPHMSDGGFDAPPAAWPIIGTASATRVNSASVGRDLYPGEPLITYGYPQKPDSDWSRYEPPRTRLAPSTAVTRIQAPSYNLPGLSIMQRWEAATMRPVQFTGWPWDPGQLLDGG